MLGYTTAVDILIQMKIVPIHFADLTAGCLDNHPCGRQILIGFIGDNGGIRPALGYIAYVSGRTTQIPDFTGKFRAILLMESRKGQQQTLVIYVFFGIDINDEAALKRFAKEVKNFSTNT